MASGNGKKKTTKKAKLETPAFTTKSKIKEYMKEAHGLRVSGEFIEGVDNQFRDLLDRAATRTQDNSRATVRPTDF